jgi:TRAP-type C4-dicarboxylate transport system substrate-binding protein
MRVTTSAVAIGIAGCVLAGGALAAEKWNMATAFPDPFFHTKNIYQFNKEIAAETKGDLKITVHSASSLFKLPEIQRAVQTGQVQIGETVVSLAANEDRVFEVDSLLFFAESYAESKRLWTASKPFIAKRLAKKGLTLLYSVPWPPQGFYAKKELMTAGDFKGLKFRAYNATVSRFAVAVGAVPTTVQLVDIPQAFSTGIVDAMITSATTGVLTKSWDYLSHFHDTKAGLGKNMVIANTRAMRRLSKATRQAVIDAAARAEPRGWEWSSQEHDKMVATLAKNLTVVPPKPALMKGLRAVGARLIDDWLANAGPDGKKILDAYRASK